MQNEVKKNIQGTNSEKKETGTQINDLEQNEEINIQLEQNEKTTIQKYESSGQDRGVGRNLLLPHTTERRITTNLKSINNQKCQKIKLHGTPTTTELKKQSTRTTRLVRLEDGENPQQGG